MIPPAGSARYYTANLGKTKKKHAYTKQINLQTTNIPKLINKYKIGCSEGNKKPPRGKVAVQGTTNEKIIYKGMISQGQDMSSVFVQGTRLPKEKR